MTRLREHENVVPMPRRADPGALYERWLETGDLPDHGPAAQVVMARAREALLTYREMHGSGPGGA